MWYVYILENQQERTYIGISEAPKTRLQSHNKDSGHEWTQGKGPWRIIYTETFQTKSEALRREKKLKSLKAGKKIKQILEIADEV